MLLPTKATRSPSLKTGILCEYTLPIPIKKQSAINIIFFILVSFSWFICSAVFAITLAIFCHLVGKVLPIGWQDVANAMAKRQQFKRLFLGLFKLNIIGTYS